MQKMLQRMQSIDQYSNDSQTEEDVPTGMSQQTKQAMKLVKIGTAQQQSRAQEMDLDNYLQTQRANTKSKAPPKYKTKQEKQKEKQYKEGYGKGFSMLAKMGFNVGKGLGKNEQGRTNIVEAQFKTSLTTKDEDYQEQEQRRREKQEKQQNEKELINPYNMKQFEDLFTYRSRQSDINSLIVCLKNKYEIAKSKLDLNETQNKKLRKHFEIMQSFKIQKQRQKKEVDEEVKSLEQISKHPSKIYLFPHLGINYKADLLIVKQAIDNLSSLSIAKTHEKLQSQINKVTMNLGSLYLAKQKETLKGLGETTDFDLKMKKIFKNEKNEKEINFKNVDFEITSISKQDEEKIKKFKRIIIEQSGLIKKLQTYMKQNSDISSWPLQIVNVVEIIDKNSKELSQEIKKKLIIPLLNNYLISYKPELNKRLPHTVVFPWLLQILKPSELDILGFIKNLSSKLWPFENDELLSIMHEWFKIFRKQQLDYFVNFYLAPRMLFEIQLFNPSSGSGNQKQKIKGFLKYFQYIPQNLRIQIIENSIGLTLLRAYKKELASGSHQKQDLKMWIMKWIQKFDIICQGVIKNVFIENGVKQIW